MVRTSSKRFREFVAPQHLAKAAQSLPRQSLPRRSYPRLQELSESYPRRKRYSNATGGKYQLREGEAGDADMVWCGNSMSDEGSRVPVRFVPVHNHRFNRFRTSGTPKLAIAMISHSPRQESLRARRFRLKQTYRLS
mmetsp:Transcript_88348/g.139599  ORF Transcript_88348/g.139599 Transcript_88348/m.139599 type:complete len:137 (-) Transcript_88348:58-468(-)